MTSEELETIVRKHEMQRLELKESFSTECIDGLRVHERARRVHRDRRGQRRQSVEAPIAL